MARSARQLSALLTSCLWLLEPFLFGMSVHVEAVLVGLEKMFGSLDFAVG